MTHILRIVAVALVLSTAVPSVEAAVRVGRLHVEYRDTPLGIDVRQPRFSWQLQATESERGETQVAYRIEVRNPRGGLVWDSTRTAENRSVHVTYAGSPLAPATRYTWTVTVWTGRGATLSGTSWFETGLLDPSADLTAWEGARWIGGGPDDLVLYAPYLAIFDVSYVVAIAPGSSRAAFVWGANDPRLMDRYKNTFQIASARDASYLKAELDISPLDDSLESKARLHLYRAGYADTDNASRPIVTFEIDRAVINRENRHAEHTIGIRSAFGQVTLTVDGSSSLASKATAPAGAGGGGSRGAGPNVFNLNPMGQGGDYIAFGMLCDIGFSVNPGEHAAFRDVVVRHVRAPNNILFAEQLRGAPYTGIFADALTPASGVTIADGRYVLAGGNSGTFVVRDPSRHAMPMLRTTFDVSPTRVASARLYVTARGIYDLFLNGTRISNDHYNPGLTQYNRTHLYQTYDVTGLVKTGRNALGAMLGEGWWSGLLSFGTIWNHFGDRQSLLATLVITYDDGTRGVVTTNDRTWKYYGRGPLIYSSLDMGEIYDATREAYVAGWSTAAYQDSGWKPAVVVPLEGTTYSGPDGGGFGAPGVPFTFDRLQLVGQIGETASVFRTITAQSVREVRPGVFVYDLGQNIVGVPKITFPDGRPGTRVTLRVAEMLYPDLPASGKNVGMVMVENYRAAISHDVYTMKAGPQTFQPRFTSHGFQYIEVTGLPGPLPASAVQGVAISSVNRLTADYKTSSEKINRLWSNLVWSNVDNFLSIPTDCPQRNERMGWSGDINVFSRTATYVSDADQFLTRHMLAMRDVQRPDGRFTDVAPVGGGFGGVLWGTAGIVVPWEVYLQYGDVGLLADHYPAMVAYLAYLDSTIDPKTGLSRDGMLGDWLGPQNTRLGSAILVTAYHAYALDITARVADILGQPADATRFRERYAERKAFFNTTFVNAEQRTLATGSSGFGGPRQPAGSASAFRVADTQTSYAVPLALGVFSDDLRARMAQRLADTVTGENTDDDGVVRPPYSLMTGFIGTAWISKALSRHGFSELAYRQLHNNRYPSWLYAVDQGATTIWERLNGYTIENGFGGNNSMNSFNHYSFGAVGQWMIAHSLGIERETPGFQAFVLQPEPDPTGMMTWAEGHYDSMYGRIASAWSVAGTTLTYRATVPANTTATLYLPTSSVDSVREGVRDARQAPGVTFVRHEQGKAVFRLVSGTYTFTAAR